MSRFSTYLLVVFGLLAGTAQAQLSPGDLTSAHAEFEGIANCTQCHDLGNKVTNAKCLECHKEIASLIDNKQGYHASKEVANHDCTKCHSEHHGRKFDMVRFDQDAFDHDLTGYALEGQHKVIDCRECHIPEYIQDSEIAQLEETFLGLNKECLSCHDDFHQETLDQNCVSCHDIEAWRPAPGFDHAETDYPLEGKHIDVDCIECHQMETRNGVEFQVFAGVEFNDCISCHDDAHEGHLEGACITCHTLEDFNIFTGKRTFNHNTTEFKLKGAHQSTDCFECHTRSSDPLTAFQDQFGIAENDCISCHEDEHEGRYGNDCVRCHQESSFLTLKEMDFFDHSVTDYPLEGKHVEVDCKECHTERYSEPIDFSNCFNCHDDYHNGEFTADGVMTDCVECHSPEEGFEYSLYTVEQHQESNFPLVGAHLATPCFACHLDEDENWKFKDIGLTCIDCHDNVHGEDFAVDGVTDCIRCHDSETWYPSLFDHDDTAFPLEGQHVNVACNECHEPDTENEELRTFKIERFECIDCHQ